MHHIAHQLHGIQSFDTGRNTVDGVTASAQRTEVEAHCRQIIRQAFQYRRLGSRQLNHFRKQHSLRYPLFLANLIHIPVEQHTYMRAMLVYQHQTGFYGGKNKASLELQMLRSLLHRRRLTEVQQRRLGRCRNRFCHGRSRFPEIKRLFRHNRLVHLARFLQAGVQPLPFHALTGIITSATVGRGR